MKFADINRQFTEIVAGYLKAGYTFNTATMGGSPVRDCPRRPE